MPDHDDATAGTADHNRRARERLEEIIDLSERILGHYIGPVTRDHALEIKRLARLELEAQREARR